jgi:hypothetical protein
MMRRGSKQSAGALAALLAIGTIAPAVAAGPCYRPAEIEAEQAVRYQARIMVLSDTCNDGTYRDFTLRNREVIVSYQKELIERYRRGGAHRPEASLDNYMTGIANEYSLANGTEIVTAVCQRSAALLSEAAKLDKAQFRHHVEELVAENRAAYKTCPK